MSIAAEIFLTDTGIKKKLKKKERSRVNKMAVNDMCCITGGQNERAENSERLFISNYKQKLIHNSSCLNHTVWFKGGGALKN